MIFVAKIDARGNALLYSTYLGGSGNDRAYTPEIGGGTGAGIGVDPVGNVYVTGSTESSDFPVHNAIQSTFGGDSDAFIAGINAGGDALIYSTYFGGLGAESGAGLAVDSRGSVYVAGTTGSSVPITPAAAIARTAVRSYQDCDKHRRQRVAGKSVLRNTIGGNNGCAQELRLEKQRHNAPDHQQNLRHGCECI